ncbi:MAG TPA: heparinase II/III family protein [Rhizomicrobium sp.]|nr:heparinase II/III family protein [Rhizomicrobium sp.]
MPLALLPEALRAFLWRLMMPLRVLWRRNWFYRRLLKGKMPDRIAFYPYDALPRRLDNADALLRGRFRFAGETVDARGRCIFDLPPPSTAWSERLNDFSWLPDLASAGGEPARALATALIGQWVARNRNYSEPGMAPHMVARRLAHVFSHSKFVLSNSDMLWRSKLFVSLREQARLLARLSEEAPEGLPRLEAAAVHALSGACLDDNHKRLQSGLERLKAELAVQVLPDGGHISRSPEALTHAYRLVVMVTDTLVAIQRPVPQSLRSAHDRMAPMLRFFRHGDGALALFNGGSESDARMITGLLARDDVRGQPFAYAPHSGYQRMIAARTMVVLDCGENPPGVYANTAHAGILSFEFSNGSQRIVVNCGSGNARDVHWDSALRATAAHSTVTIADTSIAGVLSDGFVRDLIGPRMLDAACGVDTSRRETPQGVIVEAKHDGYVHDFGISHERTLSLSPNGGALSGLDRLAPKGARKVQKRIPFAIRFHIHPDVRMSPNQGGGVLLKLPNGDGWRFRHTGGDVSIEESVYRGTDQIRKTEQLVITGEVGNESAEIGWIFEQIVMG